MEQISIGDRFGHLTVIKPVSDNSDCHRWLCKCDCGNIVELYSSNLLKHTRVACGACHFSTATMRERLTMWNTDIEREASKRFNDIRKRCYNKNNRNYKYFGGRGITICNEWLEDRRKFVSWCVDHGFEPDLRIARKDLDGPFSPENCRIVPPRACQNAQRRNKCITYAGKTMSLSMWAVYLGVIPDTLYKFSSLPDNNIDLNWYIEFKYSSMSEEARAASDKRIEAILGTMLE